MKVVQGSTAHKLSVGGDKMHPSQVNLKPEAMLIIHQIMAQIALREEKKRAG